MNAAVAIKVINRLDFLWHVETCNVDCNKSDKCLVLWSLTAGEMSKPSCCITARIVHFT